MVKREVELEKKSLEIQQEQLELDHPDVVVELAERRTQIEDRKMTLALIDSFKSLFWKRLQKNVDTTLLIK